MNLKLERMVEEERRILEGNGQLSIRALAHTINKLREQFGIIDFALADPDFKYPEEVSQALINYIKQRKSVYLPSVGMKKAREAIKEYENNFIGEKFYKSDDAIICTGVTEALRVSLEVIADIGDRNYQDRVILLSPYFTIYKTEIEDLRMVPEIINPNDKLAEQLEGKINQKDKGKVRAIIVNSPNNPKGTIEKQQNIIDIASIAKKYRIYVLSDEVYKSLIYEKSKKKYLQIAKIDPYLTITLDGLSKMHSMSGIRGGWIITKNRVIKERINRKKELMHTSNCELSEIAIHAALTDSMYYPKKMSEIYELNTTKTRKIILEELKDFGVECENPDAAFYLLVKIPNTNSIDLTWYLLKNKIGCLPGSLFDYETYKDYIRIALCNYDLDTNVKGVREFTKVVKEYFKEQ